jgi:hypothetical protein
MVQSCHHWTVPPCGRISEAQQTAGLPRDLQEAGSSDQAKVLSVAGDILGF